MAKMLPICVNVKGKDIVFFAELGLSNEEYLRRAEIIYNKHYRKPKAQLIKDLLIRFIQEDKPIADFQDEIEGLQLGEEESYDFAHLLAIVQSFKYIED